MLSKRASSADAECVQSIPKIISIADLRTGFSVALH